MTKSNEAIDVLEKARDQMINEIAQCGSGGGIGRAQNYAPILVSISEAIYAIESTFTPKNVMVDRMAAVRAAKVAKQAVAA